jgi:hypothetical protein
MTAPSGSRCAYATAQVASPKTANVKMLGVIFIACLLSKGKRDAFCSHIGTLIFDGCHHENVFKPRYLGNRVLISSAVQVQQGFAALVRCRQTSRQPRHSLSLRNAANPLAPYSSCLLGVRSAWIRHTYPRRCSLN